MTDEKKDILEEAKQYVTFPTGAAVVIVDKLIQEVELLRSQNEVLDNLCEINLREPEIKITDQKAIKVHIFRSLQKKIGSLMKELEASEKRFMTCDYIGCDERVTGGTPQKNGLYHSTCSEHHHLAEEGMR